MTNLGIRVLGLAFIIVGVALSLTIIGALIGLPLLGGGLYLLVKPPKAVRLTCPICQQTHQFIVASGNKGVTCPTCKHRLLVSGTSAVAI